MSILFRYILGEYFKIFGFCLGGTFVVFFMGHTIDIIRRFARYDPPSSALIQYFLLQVPQMLLNIIPLAVLLAVVLTLGFFARNNEILAMKAGGISTVRISAPFLIVSFAISVFLFLANLSLMPLLKQQTDYVKDFQIKNRAPYLAFRQHRIWMRLGPYAFMNVHLADSQESSLYGVNLYLLRPDYSLKEYLEAEQVRYKDGAWVVYNGVRKVFLKDGRIETDPLDGVVIPLNREPEDFVQIEKDTDKMTYKNLAAYADTLEKEGYKAQRYRVDLYTKTALPFIPFVFALIGTPLGLHRGIGQAISRGVGMSLIMALAYWILFSVCVALGYGQIIPPLISAWLPNILFALAGSWLLLQANQT